MNMEDLKGATILVVDDNPTNLEALSDCLTEFGFTVLLKQDGEKALELTKRKLPDLILLDIVMPEMDGFETCKRLKQNKDTKDIPIIFMSALSDTIDKLKGFELGAVDYITKPFQQEEVLARVKAHLTIQSLRQDLQAKNTTLQELLEREWKLVEDLRLNLSIVLPHELRTPLNAILGFAQLLTDPLGLPKSDKIAEYANNIYQSSLRLHRLVENALLYANLKLLKYTPSARRAWQSNLTVDATRLITSVAQKKAKEDERQADLILELVNTNVRVSPNNFEKILTELLDNAFKFSEAGTPVRIKTTVNGSLCVLSITDQGRGMAKEQIDNIGAYMQFDRRQYEQQGSGLGLIIAYLLAQLEGGVLSIDSEVGQGTTISIVFNCQPTLADTPAQDRRRWFSLDSSALSEWLVQEKTIVSYNVFRFSSEAFPEPVEEETAQKLKIVVIADYEKNCADLANLLAPAGFEIIEASDGYEGLMKVAASQPDLVVIDGVILAMNDFEMARAIQKASKPKPIKIFAVIDQTVNFAQQNNITTLCDAVIYTPMPIYDLLDKLETYLGVEWVYKDQSRQPRVVVPPEDDLKKLYELVVIGDLQGLSAYLDVISQRNEQYRPFTDKLQHFAEAYQMDKILRFLSRYVTDMD